MKKTNHCPNCGVELGDKVFNHNLTPGLIKTLLKLVKNSDNNLIVRVKWDNGVLLGSELGNYSKLQYWGLIQKTDEKGLWAVMPKAISFLKGDIQLPRRVKTLNTDVVSYSDEYVSIEQYKRGIDEDYWQVEFPAERLTADTQPKLF